MESTRLEQLGTLSHPQRMDLFRLLMRRYPDAVPAGEIVGALGFKPSTASVYLAALREAGLRIETDLRNEKINYKVREHSLAKVPHLLVVGNREAEEGTVAVRTLGEKDQRVMSLDDAIAMLRSEATPPDLR